MKEKLISSTLLLVTLAVSCQRKQVDSSLASCYPDLQLTRSHQVVDAPVVVEVSGGLASGFQLVSSNGVKWNSCHLPPEFGHGNLAIYVSGYFLTSPEIESQNRTPLPFEVTAARLR